MNLRFLILPALLSLAVGCSGMNPRTVTPEDNLSSIKLEKDYIFMAEYATGVKYEYTIKSGIYEPAGLDSKGVYYGGSPSCIITKVIETSWVLTESLKGKVLGTADCGVYVPNNKKSLKVYTVIGTNEAWGNSEPTTIESQKVSTSTFTEHSITPGGAAGVGIGVGVVNALIEAEKGRFTFVRNQKITSELIESISFLTKTNQNAEDASPIIQTD
ncbi:hypothetical protein FE810_02015 [Thalassotalea litorea]|uniref:Lipoprotein n=1 Tax=Thalassotalea litorea TaxID=2020715 RepID=A0A5R9IV89_9GAMM|nr:hypothetical protein [Thalassotalea litorea]TLU67086.1 hypothetical protein FE810_02015 [Thalassotalea litorea]